MYCILHSQLWVGDYSEGGIMSEYNSIESSNIYDCVFYDSGADVLLKASIPMLVEGSIFVNENVVSDDDEMIVFIGCTFIGCTGLPNAKRMHKCRIIDKRVLFS